MDGVLQKVVAILISVIIFFILPVYIAYEKEDDISYALALKITTDFVDSVEAKGYISNEMYNDFVAKLSTTKNSYDIYMEHTAKVYNPVIYSYTDDLKTIRAKFDYNLYKSQYESGTITVDSGSLAGTYNNLVLAYDLAEKKYTEEQILDVISSKDRTLSVNTSLDSYKLIDYRNLPALNSIYMPNSVTQVYTMNKGDEFNIIVKNKNTTAASLIFNLVTFGAARTNNTKIYVNYGGTIKAETYRDKTIIEDSTNYNPEDAPPDSGSNTLINSYITTGMVMLLNGEYNNGATHSNSTNVWTDISGNGNNATLSGFDFNDESGWIYNGLHFTGKEYVALNDFDSDEFTIEVVCKFDSVTDVDSTTQSVLSSINDGGAGLVFNTLTNESILKRGKASFDVYTTEGLSDVTIYDSIIQANKVYSISGSLGKMELQLGADNFAYETSAQLLGINGKYEGIPYNNNIQKPATGTTFVLGGNPLAGAGAETTFKGTIYCVRVYNRALTEEELKENFKVDQQRYGIK